MKAGRMKKSVCRASLSLWVLLAAVVGGQTAVGADPSGTPSVLDRVQTEADSELGELIRIAVANRTNMSERERFEAIRKVRAARIKLLDRQIDRSG
jgi:hypothetical protein